MSPTRLIVLMVLTAVAVGIALVLQRRRPDPPSAPSYRAPAQLDRDDFTIPPGRWMVVLFGSVSCHTCPVTWATVGSVVGTGAREERVTARRVDVQTEPALHRRYRIDGVPTTVVADPEGVVVQTFFGPMSEAELTEALLGNGAA